MGRRTDRRPLRWFVYVSDAKLAGPLDQIGDRARRSILEKLRPSFGVNLMPVNVSVQPQPADKSVRNRSLAVQVALAEEHIQQQFPVGDLATGGHWISGRADMEWAILQDGQTVLFCGYAGPLLVALGGSADHLIGQTPSGNRTGSYSYAIRTAVLNGDDAENLGNDLAATARTICLTPQPVRFLARVLMRGSLAGDGPQREFVLATPLYVEDDHRAGEFADIPVLGTVRWFSADRGWGLIASDGDQDAVVVDASAVAADGGPVLAAGQRVEFRVTHGAAGIQATSVRSLQPRANETAPGPVAVTRSLPLSPSDPEWIDRYQVLRRLGEGSMGMVYLARGDDGSLVAVKVIRLEYARDPVFLRRFQAEADSASRVCAPNVASVIAAVIDAEQPYLVTEFIDGLTLEEHVEQHGPLPTRSAIELSRTVAAALAVIHQAGIVHRDLTPSNVILSGSGPKVIDFGIAHTVDSDIRHTRVGRPVGTPAYMSPEQINEGELTPASDIFSWAGLTVFAATGHQPFARRDSPVTAVWRAISDGDPNLGGVPGQLRDTVTAALGKDPAQRPTAEQLLKELDVISLQPSPSPPESRFWLKKLRIGRNIQIAGIATAVAILAIGALVWTIVPGRSGNIYSGINYSGGNYKFDQPEAIAADSTHVWVANNSDNSVTELNASNGTWIQTLSGSKYQFNDPTGIADDGTHVWIGNANGYSVTELNASNGAWIQTLSGSKYQFNYPKAIAAEGSHVWVANGDGNSVTELNASNGAWIQTLSGSSKYQFNDPTGIADDGTHVWVGDKYSVTELNASNGAWIQTLSGRKYEFNSPWSIAVEGTHIWVANIDGNSVTELTTG
jgi:serine/threonine protein kinase/cold shock CspA family protein